MCFQGFTTFQCSHTRIFESECQLARDYALWIKCMCDNYHIESRRSLGACGDGKFYCKETKDGPFLDEVHRKLALAQNQLAIIHSQIQGVMAAQAAFSKAADQVEISLERRKQHPAFHRLLTRQHQLTNQQSIANDIRSRHLMTIQEAKEFYARRAQRALAGSGTRTPI